MQWACNCWIRCSSCDLYYTGRHINIEVGEMTVCDECFFWRKEQKLKELEEAPPDVKEPDF
jgi:hypothetical protein